MLKFRRNRVPPRRNQCTKHKPEIRNRRFSLFFCALSSTEYPRKPPAPVRDSLPSSRRRSSTIAAVSKSTGTPHRVEIVVKDYEDRADSATSVARALINQERIDALIGPQFSRHAIPVSVVAENARMPMLSPMSSNPATTKGKNFVFRLAFLDDFQGSVMGRFAANELGASRAAVLYDKTTAYGRSLSDVFRRAFEDEGGQIVAFESYTFDEPLDYREQLARIGATDPDVLYLPNDTERVVAQIRQASELGIDAILLGGDMWDMEAFNVCPRATGRSSRISGTMRWTRPKRGVSSSSTVTRMAPSRRSRPR